MGKLMKGRHQSEPEVETSRARRYRLVFAEPPAYETDGEWNKARSAELLVESVPAALRVLTPAPR
jgi:diacylglycerol kinase family enzyme